MLLHASNLAHYDWLNCPWMFLDCQWMFLLWRNFISRKGKPLVKLSKSETKVWKILLQNSCWGGELGVPHLPNSFFQQRKLQQLDPNFLLFFPTAILTAKLIPQIVKGSYIWIYFVCMSPRRATYDQISSLLSSAGDSVSHGKCSSAFSSPKQRCIIFANVPMIQWWFFQQNMTT